MDIENIESKNGLKSLKINSIFYHSSYDPEKEAQRFSDSISLPYIPSILFIIEPGLNYCIKYLKEKYPSTKIYTIRFIPQFYDDNNSILYENFTNYCFKHFNSEELLNSLVITWPSAEKVFPSDVNNIWQEYKKHLEIRKTELVSRQYFEKKWLTNSFYFFKYLKNIILLNQTNSPVLVVASGPSLKDNLSFIKENQNKMIIIGLSSAINVLLKNNIIPDFCVSTDGGFWAKKHLYPLNNKNIPLAITSESGVPKKYLENIPIIPLSYSDGLSSELFRKLNISYIQAERNPTVSGTALILARQLTSSKIYFSGLDLCCQKGFAHCQPNILEMENSINDNRLRPTSTRTLNSEYATSSLNIFIDDFSMMENVQNCYRITNKYINNKLGKIRDISVQQFQSEIVKLASIDKTSLFQPQTGISQKDQTLIREKLSQFLKENENSESFMKNLFPIDYISISHAKDVNKKVLINQLNEKKDKILKKLWRILDEK